MSMPAIGTRAVHKDDHAKQAGPVWEVYGQREQKQEVDIKTVAGHKKNVGVTPQAKTVSVPDFQKDYVQL